MVTSRNTGNRISGGSLGTTLAGLPDLSRYDAVLAAIPLVFALVLSAHAVLAVSVQQAILAGSLLSSLLVVDAIYVNPPSKQGS